MAESDHSEPYRTHDQVHIPTPNVVDKTAATNQPGDTQHTGMHLVTLDWTENLFYFYVLLIAILDYNKLLRI